MNRRRSSWRSLSTTRIYQKRKRFYLFSAEEMVNPKTGKAARWHSLCSLEEGEDRARQIAKEIQRYNTVTESGDISLNFLRDLACTIFSLFETAKTMPSGRLARLRI